MEKRNPVAACEADQGLGTTYERFAIYRWLEELVGRFPVRFVLEGPGDGVAGIPGIHSLPLALRGCLVTVVLENPAEIALAQRAWAAQGCLAQVDFIRVDELPLFSPPHRFDLVWNFNRLPFTDPAALIGEMARLSRRYVALVVPNRRNYGFPARRLYHRRTRLPWPYGDRRVMHPEVVRRLLERAGLRLLEVRWLDVAPWPDILDPRAWLAAMVPAARRLLKGNGRGGYRWGPEELPYFDPITHADLHRRMHRLGWLERTCPAWMQVPFAHHFAVIAELGDARD